MFNKIPLLIRINRFTIEGKDKQAVELLTTFFPPLPAGIKDKGPRPQQTPILMPRLIIEEVEWKMFIAKP